MKLQLLLLPAVLALFLESAEGAQVEVGASGGQKGRWKKKSKKKKDDGYKLDDPAADHTKKGIELDTAGDKDAAILSFGAAAEFDESPSTLMNYGVSLLRVARIEEARVVMDKALVLAPGDASILKNIEALEGAEKEMAGKGGGVKAPPGLSKKGKGKGAGKKNKYQRPGGGGKKNKYKRPGSGAAKGPPSMTVNVDGYDVNDPNGDHTAQAIKFDGQGKKAESILAFQAAAKFSPGQTTHMNYAVSLMRSRQYKKALAAMEEAVKLAPNEGQVKDNMAALTQSISVDDGSPEAVALRKEHPGRFDVAKKAGKRKKKYQ
jgi:Flp pilus assembly protein TadD